MTQSTTTTSKLISLTPSEPPSILSMICSICHEAIGPSRPDGSSEIRYALPCGHLFGHLCIMRWLQDSPQHDCPHCRRTMIHPGCNHLIMPHDASTAPPSISEKETPELCVRCRGEGAIAKVLRFEHERLQAQEMALRGLQVHLPTVFRGAPKSSSEDTLEVRIEQLRREFAGINERAFREFAERERREKW